MASNVSHFRMNTDFAAEKQAKTIDISVSQGALGLAPGQMVENHVDFDVPSGTFFETTALNFSLVGSYGWINGNSMIYQNDQSAYVVVVSCFRIGASKYRISIANYNLNPMGSATVGACSARALVKLSRSPF